MTFLNPLILFGLAAAGIPILLHLFNLRKLEKVEFSTLRFLRELQKTKIRRLKLRQLLLLALRTLLIILIVCAFARPTLRNASLGGGATHAKTTAVILFDNSYTMTSTGENGEYLRTAREDAAKILDLMKDGDDVFFVPWSEMGSIDKSGTAAPRKDFAAVRSELDAVQPSYRHTTTEDALRRAAGLLATAKNLNKEVYLISDFKLGNFRPAKAQQQAEDIFPSGTRFFLLPVGDKPRQNLGVEAVKVENSLLVVGKPLNLDVSVANWGTRDVKDEVVSVFVNGARVSQQAIDIASQRTAHASFSITPQAAGILHGVVELQDDDLEFDNRRSFVLNIPASLRALLVGTPADLRYTTTALSVQPAGGTSTVSVKTVSAERLSTNDIDAADVIVFANVRDLSPVQRDQLRRFVESGGGVIYFPGSKSDSASYTSTWSRGLGLPPVRSVVHLQSSSGQQRGVTEFEKVDFRHPVFEGMFEDDPLRKNGAGSRAGTAAPSLASPSIQTYTRYETNARSSSIITLSDGSPFLFEQKLQEGIVLAFGVSATSDWSDFPLSGLFVPLLYRTVMFAGQQQAIPPAVAVGEDAMVSLKTRGLSTVVVQNPEKVDIVAPVSNTGREGTVRFSGTTVPGIYSVRSADKVLDEFAVTLDPAESNTIQADRKTIDAVFRNLGVPPGAVQSLDQRDRVRQTVLQSRVGVELWKYFVAASLLVGLLELVVGRTTRREVSAEGYPPPQQELTSKS
ncbi:MAG TPA: BatA domain-containing protein [Bacteroidota bacterium]|nr:BatA domain-containing protein [Bacteroidota bacterium]